MCSSHRRLPVRSRYERSSPRSSGVRPIFVPVSCPTSARGASRDKLAWCGSKRRSSCRCARCSPPAVLRRSSQLLGDLPVPQSAREQPQHLHLTGLTTRPAIRAGAATRRPAAQHRVHRLAIKSSCRYLWRPLQFAAASSRDRAGRMRAHLRHRVYNNQPAPRIRPIWRDRITRDAARIPRTVNAPVVLHRDRALSGASAGENASIRSLRYGCNRTRSQP